MQEEKTPSKGKIGTQGRHHLTKTSVFLPNSLAKERLSSNKPQMFHVKHLRLIIKNATERGHIVCALLPIRFEWQESDKVAHIDEEQSERTNEERSEYVNKDCSERTGKE